MAYTKIMREIRAVKHKTDER